MFGLAVALLIFGVLAILLEILMPGFDGFISGVVGILALIASAILAIFFIDGGVFLVAINLGIIGFASFMFFSLIKSKRLQGKIINNDTLVEAVPPLDYAALIGKEGKTVTALRPYGEADFGGIRTEVSSDGGTIIERGSRIKVMDVQGTKVIVALWDGN